MQIGPYQLDNQLMVAPMAGVTDLPFRRLCLRLGAGLAVSEMLSSNPLVWKTEKSMARMDHGNEKGIRSVQIAGCDPELMAEAARFNVERGAQIIDINMGCPAKKVNKKLAGSALLREPELVKRIIGTVVNAVDIPVTLKIRTGWDPDSRNGIEIATIAEQQGIASLAVHGRTRQCMYKGNAEYDTIKAIKQAVSIPVVANGDITTAEKAKQVLDYTGADALMIGRGAQGQPWIFGQIDHYLKTGEHLAPPSWSEQAALLQEHLEQLHQFYGPERGMRIARKHIGWYLDTCAASETKREFNRLETAQAQSQHLSRFFEVVIKTR